MQRTKNAEESPTRVSSGFSSSSRWLPGSPARRAIRGPSVSRCSLQPTPSSPPPMHTPPTAADVSVPGEPRCFVRIPQHQAVRDRQVLCFVMFGEKELLTVWSTTSGAVAATLSNPHAHPGVSSSSRYPFRPTGGLFRSSLLPCQRIPQVQRPTMVIHFSTL